jgi:putative transposase
MRAVQLTSFADPVDGLQCVDIPEPDAPGPNQVLIGVEFSPINPNDLMVAQGIYAFRPPLPAVIDNEGVGRVLAVGPGVESVKAGDRVLAPPASFTWRERIVVSAGGLGLSPYTSSTNKESPSPKRRRTMKRSRFSEEQIIAILKEQEAGTKTVDVCRKYGISDATFYKWKSKYGGLEASEAKRLKALEDENAKLKRLLAETMLDNAMLKDIAAKKW